MVLSRHGERAAFDLAIAASQVPNAVNETLAENARQYWEEGEIVEIIGCRCPVWLSQSME